MKKLFAIGMLALLSLAGCSDDDNNTPSVNFDQIAKRWFYVSTKIGNQTSPYEGNLPCGKDYLEFQVSGLVREVDYFDCQQDPAITNGTYAILESSNQLTTVIDGETVTYTVTKLNSRELEAEATFNNIKITSIFTSVP